MCPRYAQQAVRARRKAERTIQTIKKIPEPHTRVLYAVGDAEKTLDGWHSREPAHRAISRRNGWAMKDSNLQPPD